MRIRFIESIALLALAAAPCNGQGTIIPVPGSATCCAGSTSGLARDAQGNLYVWTGSALIKKLTPGGVVSTFAGNNLAGYTGDGGPATAAQLFGGVNPGLAIDPAGNVYLADGHNNVVRMVNAATGIITTIAGNGTAGFAGDGGPASKSQLNNPVGLAFDSAGNLYIGDENNSRVRKISTSGTIGTFAGNGNITFGGDGVQATATAVVRPQYLTLDTAGNLYIAETDQNRIRKVSPTGVISTYAGQTSGKSGFSGDGGQATSAQLFGPLGMAVDASGNLFFADNQNGRIREISATGVITTYAGVTGNASTPIGEGGPATSAFLGAPIDVLLDSSGILYLTDSLAPPDGIREISAGTAAAASLIASPASLSFSFTAGGTSPASQALTVSSTGSALTLTAVASTTSGANWLSVSPGSGITPANLTVSVNPSGLTANTYKGAVTLTPGSGSPLVVSVTLAVNAAGAPAITAGGIVNGTGYQPVLAPDTVFTIFGNNLGPATLQSAIPSPSYPTNFGGTSIAFTPTGGGSPIAAGIVYTFASQVAGLLPSSIATGTYNVTVTYNNQVSASQPVTVVARSFGIATANSAGSGTPQATIGNINNGLSLTRFTTGSLAYGGYNWTLSPAHPGDTVVLWGTGGGADAANDTGGTSGDQTAAGNFVVTVAGVAITPFYAGASSGYPGLFQINFTLPASIPTDCFSQLQVSAGGQLSNTVLLPIAPAGQNACSTPGYTATTLATLDAGGNVIMAGFSYGRIYYTSGSTTTVTDQAGGQFARYSAAEWLRPFQGPVVGPCRVLDETYPTGGKDPSYPDAFLDAGTSLTFSGSGLTGGTAAIAGATGAFGPFYDTDLATNTLAPGATYTLTGKGGSQVQAFTTTQSLPASFSATSFASTTAINRSQPLTVTWTGTGFDTVEVSLTTAQSTATTYHGVTLSCFVPSAPGAYTVPVAALAYLLPTATGQFQVEATQNGGGTPTPVSASSQEFVPNLVGGGKVDFGFFASFIDYIKSIPVQ